MDQKAENVVQNVGAMAEVTSVFYNSIIKQVPKDVALVLTQHFMDITIARPVNVNLSAAAAAAKGLGAAEASGAAKAARSAFPAPKIQGSAAQGRMSVVFNLQNVHIFVKKRP